MDDPGGLGPRPPQPPPPPPRAAGVTSPAGAPPPPPPDPWTASVAAADREPWRDGVSTAWPGGQAPDSRRPMLVLTVAVLAVLGLAVGWSALNRESGPGPTPAVAEGTAATAMPGRPVDTGQLAPPADQAALAALLPEVLADRCEPIRVTTPQLAAVRCTTSEGYVLVYEQFSDRDALNHGWRGLLYEQDLSMGSGGCDSGSPGEAGWYYSDGSPGSDDGRDACFLDASGPVLLWTDYATDIRAWLHGTADTSIETLFARWDDGDFDPVREP
jgi:hypothetical protein